MTFTLTSAAFRPGEPIPTRYTCEGEDVSPPLEWTGVPDGVRSFALVVDDPDAPDPAAPRTRWVHWVVYDIPAAAASLPEDAAAHGLPARARVGVNDWARPGWAGPCPPVGRHRYFHTLHALDTTLGDIGQPTRAELERAMRDHILATAELVGTYEKVKKRGR